MKQTIFKVLADAGYSNGEQAADFEAAGVTPYVPFMCTVNNQGDGTLFVREDFRYPIRIPISALATRGCALRIPTIKIVTSRTEIPQSTVASFRSSHGARRLRDVA